MAFPTNPATGDKYFNNGTQYVYSNIGTWDIVGGVTADVMQAYDTTAQVDSKVADVVSSTDAKISTTVANADTKYYHNSHLPPTGRRNLLINGGFDIWQRGNSFDIGTTAAYTADRWSTQNCTISRSVLSGNDMSYRAVSKGGYTIFLQQVIEKGAVRVQGKDITISFYANVSTDFPLKVGITDSSLTTILKESTVNLIVGENHYSVTFSCPANMASASREFKLVLYRDAAVAGDVLNMSDIQLELGSVATPFEVLPIGETLSLCQRYYYKNIDAGGGSKVLNAWKSGAYPGRYSGTFSLPVRMRVVPTTVITGLDIHYPGIAYVAYSSLGVTIGTGLQEYTVTIDGGTQSIDVCRIRDQVITFDAEIY